VGNTSNVSSLSWDFLKNNSLVVVAVAVVVVVVVVAVVVVRSSTVLQNDFFLNALMDRMDDRFQLELAFPRGERFLFD
jgi:hypothetical protein